MENSSPKDETKNSLDEISERSFFKEREERTQQILEDLRQQRLREERNRIRHTSYAPPKERIAEKIEDAQETERKRLDNKAKQQDIELKKQTLDRLFKFLSCETFVIFAMAIAQGFKFRDFYLQEWSFRLLVTVTITQITIMLLVAVKHLFPQK